MRKIYCLIFCLFFFHSFTHVWAAEVYKLLVFGDSLSAGYGVGEKNSFAAFLQEELKKKGYQNVQVINKSKSGETTFGGLKRLPKVIEKVKPNGVLIELGINDVFLGKSVSSIQTNLENMIKICQEKGIFVLLAGMKAPPYTEFVYQQKFDEMYQVLANRYQLIFYPFFMKGLISLENGIPESKYTLQDNIHPNITGIKLIVANMLPYIEKFLSQKNN